MKRHISTSTGLVILALVLFAAGIAVWSYVPRDNDNKDTKVPIEDSNTQNDFVSNNVYLSQRYGLKLYLPNGWAFDDRGNEGIWIASAESLENMKNIDGIEHAIDLWILSKNDLIAEGGEVFVEGDKSVELFGDKIVTVYNGGFAYTGKVYELNNDGEILYFYTEVPQSQDEIREIISTLTFD